MAEHPLFREQATDAYADPVVKGGILQVAPPWALAFYVGLMAVALVGFGVVIFGKAETTVDARGVVRPEGGLLLVVAPGAGVVATLCDCEGAVREAGDTLALLDGDRQARVAVLAPLRAVIAEVRVRRGERVREGDVICTLIPAEAELVGYLAVPEKQRPRLRLGGRVRIKLDGYPYQEAGIGEGRIRRIGLEWLSEAWERQLQPGAAAGQERSVLVMISLDRLPPGARGSYQNGMQFTGEILLGRQRIARLLLP
jgi:multidrug efflux pump subunit AcrA (membrane-fusion protein)